MSEATVFSFLAMGFLAASAAAWLLHSLPRLWQGLLVSLALWLIWLSIGWLLDPLTQQARLPGQAAAVGAAVFAVFGFPMYALRLLLRNMPS
ncbi:MAG: hypothetical protein JOY60_00755 [Burkholderiaceae bacterium]|nr:hypothetical protein [Roseateles sp.]MBV8468378.1 hypothetical protein [Burkholderiaceae bacterium]